MLIHQLMAFRFSVSRAGVIVFLINKRIALIFWLDIDVDININDVIKKSKEEYAALFRDGCYSDETMRKSGYKRDSKKSVRRRNRKLCIDIIRDDEYDLKSYPDYCEEKHRIWDWW